MKTDLFVPFLEKDTVKALGARFDMSRRIWYVPDGVDIYPFIQWIPQAAGLSKRVNKALKRGRKS